MSTLIENSDPLGTPSAWTNTLSAKGGEKVAISKSLTPGTHISLVNTARTGVFAAPGLGALINMVRPDLSVQQALLYGGLSGIALSLSLPSNALVHMATGNIALGFGAGYWGAGVVNRDVPQQMRALYGVIGAFVAGSDVLAELGLASNKRLSMRFAKQMPSYDRTDQMRAAVY